MTSRWDDWFERILANRDSFEETARLTACALDAGVEAKWLAAAAKTAISTNSSLRRVLYSSGAAVGYHARTGRFLSLHGAMPVGVCAHDVQSLIKRIPTSAVDSILAAAESQASAYAAFERVHR